MDDPTSQPSDRPDRPPAAARMPSLVTAARVMLFVNVGLVGIIALLRFVVAWANNLLIYDRPGEIVTVFSRSLGSMLPYALLAVFSAVLGARMARGLKSTRVWTIVVASLTLLVGVSLLGGLVTLLFALPLMGLSVTVLVLVNLPEARGFFQRRKGPEAFPPAAASPPPGEAPDRRSSPTQDPGASSWQQAHSPGMPPARRFCPQCGRAVDAGASTCPRCGYTA